MDNKVILIGSGNAITESVKAILEAKGMNDVIVLLREVRAKRPVNHLFKNKFASISVILYLCRKILR